VPSDWIYSEHISSAEPFVVGVQLQDALAALRPAEIVVVPKLDRIGRSMKARVSRVAELLDRGCHVRALDGRVDTQVLGKMAKLVVGILMAAAEIEQELTLESTEEVRLRALAAGLKSAR
jgi:DNA invertase Pin-like site-specific DNA recombinase